MISASPGLDLLHADRHRAQAGAAKLVEAPCGCFLRHAGAMAAWRAGFWPWAAVRIWPMITSWTSSAATEARASAPRMAMAPSSWAGSVASAPLNDPTGVRAALAITISFTGYLLFGRVAAASPLPG
jgi:hypothetical protein